MFINFWYAAEQSENVTDKPVGVRMLGQDFVLFRDSEGKIHCLSNVCAHRGAALADGELKGDCVQCPYHGWQFNGEGRCTRIPSLGVDGKIAKRHDLPRRAETRPRPPPITPPGHGPFAFEQGVP